jgi:hypothetical protein
VAAHPRRKTTAAAGILAGGGCPRWRRPTTSPHGDGAPVLPRPWEEAGGHAARRRGAVGGVGLHWETATATNSMTAAHRPAAAQGRGARCRAAAARMRGQVRHARGLGAPALYRRGTLALARTPRDRPRR